MLVLICAAAGFVRDSRVDTDFPAIRARSTEAEVRRIMGDPKQIQTPRSGLRHLGESPTANHVFVYRSIFLPSSKQVLAGLFRSKQSGYGHFEPAGTIAGASRIRAKMDGTEW